MPLLTDVLLRKKKAPAAGRLELRDTKVTGLVFRLTSDDVRTWSVLYRVHGVRRRFTIGKYRPENGAGDGFTLGQARERARQVTQDAAVGKDPQADKLLARREAQRAGETFADLAAKWLKHGRTTKGERKGQPWRPKTRAEFERIVEIELVPVLGDLQPAAITKAHLRTLYDRIEGRSRSMAGHALAVCRLLFAWAAEEDRIDAVPLFPKRGTQSTKRDHTLEDVELRAVWAALDAGLGEKPRKPEDGPDLMAEAFRLMLLTGQRRGEVLGMKWSELTEEKDGAWWTIPEARSKGGRMQRVPLASGAVATLKRIHAITGTEAWMFPGPRRKAKAPHVANPQKAAARLWKKAGVTGARIHDFRRTAATRMTRLGIPRLVVARVLGHADADVTARYDRHAYDREKRDALDAWDRELVRIISEKDEKPAGKVLPWTG